VAVLQTFILNQAPRKTRLGGQGGELGFPAVVTCHDSPIQAGPRQFRQAFAFLEQQASSSFASGCAPEDFKFLRELEA